MRKTKKKQQRPLHLDLDTIVVGYNYAIRNAVGLVDAAFAGMGNHLPAALGIAQVAQEELGKSYLLAASATFESDREWRTFWSTWKDHEAKANQAVWYEWISTKRLAFSVDGEIRDGASQRERMSLEKEAGLYVDFRRATSEFLLPEAEVNEAEVINRIGAVLSLGQTASAVHDTIANANYRKRLPLFGAHMRQLFDGFVSQEAMHSQLEKMADGDDESGAIAREVQERLQVAWAGLEAKIEAKGQQAK